MKMLLKVFFWANVFFVVYGLMAMIHCGSCWEWWRVVFNLAAAVYVASVEAKLK